MFSDLPWYGKALALAAFFAMGAGVVSAAETREPMALVCPLHSAYFSVYDGDKYRTGTSAEETLPLTFAAIDVPRRSAQLIGNAGASSVTALAEADKIVFIERTDSGNYTTTSVSMIDARFPAVHTRQMFMGSHILTSVFEGFCEARY